MENKKSDSKISKFLETNSNWKILQNPDVQTFPDHENLVREYKFQSDKSTIEFISAVLQHAEKEDHHPLLIAEWHKVTLSWSSHEKKSITDADIEMAKKSDEIFLSINSTKG
jgi:4a-hydroxytetrahydrobiopterin dehydratase